MYLLQSRLFVEGGVTKIRLTGGEPTLRRDIVDLTRELNALPGLQAIGITTNGIALKRKLPELQAHGIKLLSSGAFNSVCLCKHPAMHVYRGHRKRSWPKGLNYSLQPCSDDEAVLPAQICKLECCTDSLTVHHSTTLLESFAKSGGQCADTGWSCG